MKKKRIKTPGSVLHTALFSLGGLGGVYLAQQLAERGHLTFAGLWDGYVAPAPFGEVVWDQLRWPLLAWLLGFTALGVVLTPLLFAARGFFLGLGAGGLAAALEGGRGLSLLVFGLHALAAVPVFFLLGLESWQRSRLLRGRLLPGRGNRSLYPPRFWGMTLLALSLLLVWAGLEFLIVPPLLRLMILH